LARFQTLKKILLNGVDVAPEQATLDLVERLRARPEVRAARPKLPTRMVGDDPAHPMDAKQAAVAPKPRRRLPLVAAGLAAALLVG
ncbi:hypothetical protein, partial [Klebsiella pneumoniae]|uniref:hypothetical protein n=1 Tax=Klebsiella pneumoniae TaxID=573 RepID=UPI001952BC82